MRAHPLPLALAALLASSAAARADDGFVELAAGAAIPVGGDAWSTGVGVSPKLVIRGGVATSDLGALELGVDYTRARHGDEEDDTTGQHRIRALLGVRGGARLGPGVRAFVRGAFGMDLMVRDYGTYDLIGPVEDRYVSRYALALELGGGVMFDLGPLELGGQVALPVSLRDFDDASVDVDVLLAAARRF